MNLGWLRTVVVYLLAVFLLTGCGGGGGGSTIGNDTGNDTGPPSIAGFDFVLTEGDFWEYDWDFKRTYVAVGSNINKSYASTFRVTLDFPMDIGGITFYKLLVSGNTMAEDNKDFAPRWNYLAVSENKILASQDGITVTTIFDAQSGVWPGSGFLTLFPATTLFEATAGTISNDYLNEAAYQVRETASKDRCEYYPGIGTICGGDYDETLIEREYYIPGVGPVGLFQYTQMSNYDWSATRTSNVGLVSSSFWGDIVVTDLEIEPNNLLSNSTPIALGAIIEGDSVSENLHGGPFTVAVGTSVNEVEPNNGPLGSAQSISVPVSVSGDVSVGDNFSAKSITFNNVSWNADIEDWYEFSLAASQNLTFLLDFQGTGSNTDLDLFLFNSSGTLVDASPYYNPSSGPYFEKIERSIPAGTYLLGVDAASEMGPVRIDYLLQVSTGSPTIDIVDWFTFTIDDASSLSLGITGGPTMVLLEGGSTIASGTSITEDLVSGTYFIGVSAGGPYTMTTIRTGAPSDVGSDSRPGGGGGGPTGG